jgi:hypothetical protein
MITMKPQSGKQREEAETDNKHGTRYRMTHSRVDPNADEIVQIG